jgi:hypothetical protein
VVGDDVPEECHDWAACDSCASGCQCDADCIIDCQRRIYARVPEDVLNVVNDPVRACSGQFVACFAQPLEGVAGVGNCAKLRACCVRRSAITGDVYCRALADDGDEAACMLAECRYEHDGSCDVGGVDELSECSDGSCYALLSGYAKSGVCP